MIPTIRFQILKYSRGNYVRLFWGSTTGRRQHPRVVFANTSQMRPYRGRGVLRLSEDGGRTWIASRTFNPTHYVYQCMAQLPSGDIALLWEREWQGLFLTTVPLAWLTSSRSTIS